MTLPAAQLGSFTVRRADASADAPAITALLGRAYRPQVDVGLRPLAGRQDAATTAKRLRDATCLLAEAQDAPGRLLGVLLLDEHEASPFPPLFKQPGVRHFSMFGVDPAAQGLGVGVRLLANAERRVIDEGDHTLACSMAAPDVALRDWYIRRGYSTGGVWNWPYTNYESLILAKRVAP